MLTKLQPFFSSFLIIMFVAFPSLQLRVEAEADPPPISIKLKLDKNQNPHEFSCNENVGIIIDIENRSSNDIILSRDLTSQRLFMNLRIVDPAGRLLIPTVNIHKASTYPLPLGFKENSSGKLVMSTPCNIFKGFEKIIQKTSDLGAYYHFEFSGYYSIQVQMGVMEFKDQNICDPKNYHWLGVLKSNTQYFLIDGKLPIRIIPNRWQKSWENGTSSKIVAQIPLHDGWKPISIDKHSIMLNKLNGPVEKIGNKMEAIYKGKNCIESLEDIQIGKSYRVLLTGSLTDGSRFCGSQNITIVP